MRISTTTLESFRLWKDPANDWFKEEDLIATIKGVFVPTPAVLLGQAFGRIVESPEQFQIAQGYRYDDYTFSSETMAPVFRLIDRRGVFEAKAVKRYGECDVVACADHLLGAQLSEFKTTSSTFNFEKYADSCQWRFMTDIFQPLVVTYRVFELDDHGNTVVEVKNISSFNLYPYAELHQDCCDLLSEFCDYVKAKRLDRLLRERQRAAA
jgi:hypothetical protein